MNLKDLLTSKDGPPELFWALVIEKGLVQAGIWYIGEDKAEVVGIGTGIPWEKDEDLVTATDAALSSAIQKLPEDYPEPQKTVFGVSSSWVKEGEITSENLEKIKKICTELSLTPVGFVVLSEAIAHLFKSEEGAPLNAIVLKSGAEALEISIFKLGNLVGTTEVSRSVSLIDDVIEGLSRFEGVSPLPTRFVIYDGKEGELEETKQTLIQANWSDGKISFLHMPQVEILSTERKVLATALAGGAEMGSATSVEERNINSSELPAEEENEENSETKYEEVKENASLESLGFAVGEDVSEMKKEDIENIVPPSVVQNTTNVQNVTQQTQPEVGVTKEESPKFIKSPNYFAKSKILFHSFSSKLFPKKHGSGVNVGTNRILTIILSILGIGFVVVAVLWGFVQTANVSIYVTPKRFEENAQVIFDTGGSYDSTAGVVPAESINDQVSGEKTKSTTGTKLIGNKATGSVQIANGNSAAINLSAGTVLTSSSGFKFTLASEASVSGQLLPGSPGTTTVNVSAYDIGSQYNLAKGEVFSVGNYSKALVAATSTADFTGGSSQQISAVGSDDQTSLEEDLKSELSQNAKADISSKISSDKILITDLAGLETVSETFDHKVGEQADSIKLNLKLNATGLAADREKLLEYAKNVLGSKTPSGYSLSSDQIDFKFAFVSGDNGKYTYNVVIGGNFLPDVNIDKIKKTISGKTTSVAKEYLNSIPGFDHANVDLKIAFPGFLKTIPRITKNITVEVKPE